MIRIRRIEVARINEQVYEAIEEAIVQCELSPGAVGGYFGVSRTPVRAKAAPESGTWCYVRKGKERHVPRNGHQVRDLWDGARDRATDPCEEQDSMKASTSETGSATWSV